VVRSVSPLALGLALTALAGCATTQQRAARLRLNDTRLRATQFPVRVTALDPGVLVRDVAIVRSAHESAVVVRVQNAGAHPLSDLPISVGLIARGGRRLYLNTSAGLDYFQTHLPGVPARGSLAWVFTTRRALPKALRAFAAVGPPGPGTPPGAPTLPRILVVRTGRSSGRGLRVSVSNPSPVPQYQLQVYAVAQHGRREVGAAQATIAQLESGASADVQLKLVGDLVGASVALEAAPTIFG
jgi:hypothetical protein